MSRFMYENLSKRTTAKSVKRIRNGVEVLDTPKSQGATTYAVSHKHAKRRAQVSGGSFLPENTPRVRTRKFGPGYYRTADGKRVSRRETRYDDRIGRGDGFGVGTLS